MKNSVKYFALTLSAFVLGMAINNFAMSTVPSRVAVVDVNKLLESSAQYKKINKEHDAKVEDLKKFVETKKNIIAKETDANKKKALVSKYEQELQTKKAAVKKDYGEKLTAFDKTLATAIKQKAEAGNYEIVLSKGVVFYGGTDITPEISKVIK